MAVTIEPGFYQIPRLLADPAEVGELEAALDRDVLARFADVRGIRIEDDVLVTDIGQRSAHARHAENPRRRRSGDRERSSSGRPATAR